MGYSSGPMQDGVTIITCWSTAALMVLGIVSKDFGGAGAIGSDNMFSGHVIGMSLGFCGFLATSVYSYALDDKSTALVPSDPRLAGARAKGRNLHALFSLLGTAAIIYGYVAVYKSHEARGESQIIAPTLLKQVHVVLGYFTMGLIAIQTLSGIAKYVDKMFLTDKVGVPKYVKMMFHGKGYLMVACGLLNMIIAVIFWPWDIEQKILLILAITMTGLTSLLPGYSKQRGWKIYETIGPQSAKQQLPAPVVAAAPAVVPTVVEKKQPPLKEPLLGEHRQVSGRQVSAGPELHPQPASKIKPSLIRVGEASLDDIDRKGGYDLR